MSDSIGRELGRLILKPDSIPSNIQNILCRFISTMVSLDLIEEIESMNQYSSWHYGTDYVGKCMSGWFNILDDMNIYFNTVAKSRKKNRKSLNKTKKSS